jgi:hypothetical protein
VEKKTVRTNINIPTFFIAFIDYLRLLLNSPTPTGLSIEPKGFVISERFVKIHNVENYLIVCIYELQ